MNAETRPPSPLHARFPKVSFVGVVILTMIAIGILAHGSFRSLRTIDGIEQNALAIERACGRIVHLDEVLTMSARLGAATGDLAWEQRYLSHVPSLDEAIAAARRLAPVTVESAGSRLTEQANDQLVALELEAFDLVRTGRRPEAAALLSGAEYERLKRIYSEGNERYLTSMRQRVSGLLHAERARAQRDKLLLCILVPLIALAWMQVGASIRAHVRVRNAVEDQLRGHAQVLERKNEEVREAARAKSEFLARMSHEIRTPMNGVLGIAEILSRTPLDAEQAHYVETIVSSGNLLESILNDILDFSKLEAGMLRMVPVPCSPHSIARDVVATMAQRAQAKGIELRHEVRDDLPAQVMLDPVRVRQVLLNLVGNAVKFTERGSVELCLGRGGSPGTLVCTVRDTGIGIPAERLQMVFESFVQADDQIGRRFGGTGLGLTICRELTRLMGGVIRAESEPGHGTVFTVELPAPVAEPLPAERSRAVDSRRWQGRVLVVEDNQVNQLVARRMLERLGCTVDVAGDGRQGLASLSRAAYDLVFMDLNMPVMDGLEATGAIRQLERDSPRTPIVAMTASAFPGDVEACRAADMDGFISKPLRERELIEVLERWAPPAPALPGPAAEPAAART